MCELFGWGEGRWDIDGEFTWGLMFAIVEGDGTRDVRVRR